MGRVSSGWAMWQGRVSPLTLVMASWKTSSRRKRYARRTREGKGVGVNHAEACRIWSGVAPRRRPSVARAPSITVPGRCSASSARHPPPPPPHPPPAAPLLQAPGLRVRQNRPRPGVRCGPQGIERKAGCQWSRKLACDRCRHAGCAGGGGCTAPRNDSLAPSASGCAAGAAGRCARISAAGSAQAAASPASSATAPT